MEWTWLIVAAPLAGAVLLLFGGRVMDRLASVVGISSMLVAFGAAVTAFLDLIGRPEGERSGVRHLFTWITSGSLDVGVNLRWDALAGVMTLVVTGVGLLIHVYSTGYMHGDPRYRRYFGYLNLFVFSMLTLVLADNLLLMFVGWELVGVCSYLLIGFHFQRPSAATAAKKAFLVTRIGDVGLMIALFLTFAELRTLNISAVLAAVRAGNVTVGLATALGLLMFAGAVGKSAQIPLYVWLPDAMEGPTPVSALIHAATMVTAGVYLVVRMGPIYELSTTASTVVASIGAATAFFAAVIAVAEEDIKRVLAYSTISQLGYMFVAAGVGAYSFAIFHLVTHAFFKALLFLAAGSVMHGLGGETSMERMGGLRRAMPWTFLVTAVGWAAITGILPFAGFFSKDAIVGAAFGKGAPVVFTLAAAGALLTAFYMSRLLFLTFAGSKRWSEGVHPHESPPSMVVPMVLLALGAVFGGVLDLPEGLPGSDRLSHFLEPVVGAWRGAESWGVTGLLWVLVVGATIVAWAIYGAQAVNRERMRERLGPLNTVVRNRFFVDEIYATLIVSPLRLAAAFFAYVVDLRLIDGTVNGIATLVNRASESWRRIQSGFVRNYALVLYLGAAALVAYFAVRYA